jgi:hypothetical protein
VALQKIYQIPDPEDSGILPVSVVFLDGSGKIEET